MTDTLYFMATIDLNSCKLKKNENYYFMEEKTDFTSEYFSKEKKEMFGLAEYISEDSPLYKKVKCIDYDIEDRKVIFEVISEEELSESLISELIEYLNGQISDGWAENGAYVLEGYFPNKVKHICINSDVVQCYRNPFYKTETNSFSYFPKEKYFVEKEKYNDAFDKFELFIKNKKRDLGIPNN